MATKSKTDETAPASAPLGAPPNDPPTTPPIRELPSNEPLLTADRWAARRIQDRVVQAFLHREVAAGGRTRRQRRAAWDQEFEAFKAAERR